MMISPSQSKRKRQIRTQSRFPKHILLLFILHYSRAPFSSYGCHAKIFDGRPSSIRWNNALFGKQKLNYFTPKISKKPYEFVTSINGIRGGHEEINFGLGQGVTTSYGVQKTNGQVTSSETKATSLSDKPPPPSPYEYIPITALDDYGQSTQLRHAMESAARFGTPVLACICYHDDSIEDEKENTTNSESESTDCNSKADMANKMENAIVVCSLQRPRLGVVSSAPSKMSTIKTIKQPSKPVHPSIQGMVKIIATRDDCHPTSKDVNEDDIPLHCLHTAMVTTGIQADAQFLQSQLHSHFTSSYWFRYNSLPTTTTSNIYSSPSAVVKMIRDILLDCLGYDYSEEVGSGKISGGIGSAAPSYSENDDDDRGSSRAGRPLGVCNFLLGLDSAVRSSDKVISPPSLILIQANGASERYVARAMGMGASLGNEMLSQRWKRCMSRSEVKAMMAEILKEIAKEKGWMASGDDENGNNDQWNAVAGTGGGLTAVFETVTQKGIQLEFLQL